MVSKTAMRAANNAVRGDIPHSGIVSAGAKIMAQRQQAGKKAGGSRKKRRARLTEISCGSGKPVLCQGVGVSRAAKKLFAYEETGLNPEEIMVLIAREKALTERVKKMEEW